VFSFAAVIQTNIRVNIIFTPPHVTTLSIDNPNHFSFDAESSDASIFN